MYVRVEARAGAKRESVLQTDDKTYAISVKEPARNNLANNRIKELLSEHLEVPVGKLRMISGHRSPRKIFTVG